MILLLIMTLYETQFISKAHFPVIVFFPSLLRYQRMDEFYRKKTERVSFAMWPLSEDSFEYIIWRVHIRIHCSVHFLIKKDMSISDDMHTQCGENGENRLWATFKGSLLHWRRVALRLYVAVIRAQLDDNEPPCGAIDKDPPYSIGILSFRTRYALLDYYNATSYISDLGS